MKCKKRRILCSLLTVILAAGVACFTAGDVSAQDFKTSKFFRQEAGTESALLQPVDKTKGVTYITDQSGRVEGINLNGNSVIIQSGGEQNTGQQYLKMWIDTNQNGVVDAGEAAVKLPEVTNGTVYENTLTEHIKSDVPIYGVYRAIAKEPILITNEIDTNYLMSTLYGVYEGQSGAITINNRDAVMNKVIAAYDSVVSGDINLSSIRSDEETDYMMYRIHEICAAQNSTVTGNITVEQKKCSSGRITAVSGGKVTGNVTLTVQFENVESRCDDICACQDAEIKGRVAVYQQGGSVSRAYAVKGGSVECDDSDTPAVMIELQGGCAGSRYYSDSVISAVSDARVTSKAETAVRFLATDHVLEGNIYVVEASDVTAAGAEAVAADVLGNSQINHAEFCAAVSSEEKKEINGNINVNIHTESEMESEETESKTSENEYNLVKGKLTVNGNVTGNMKNIDARSFSGIAGEYAYTLESGINTIINGDLAIHMEAGQIRTNVYGAQNAFIAGNYEMTGDAESIALSVYPTENATIEKSASVTWYGSPVDRMISPGTNFHGFFRPANGMDYTVGGNVEVSIPAGNFSMFNVCGGDSVIKGDVTADMHDVTGYIRGISWATVMGNVKLTVESAQVETLPEYSGEFYGISSSNIGGNVDISVTGGSWYRMYGVYNGSYNTEPCRIEGDCRVSFIKTASASTENPVYGTYYGVYGGDVAVTIREHNTLQSSDSQRDIYGMYEGTYEGAADVIIEQIEGDDSKFVNVHGTGGTISVAQDMTVTMSDIQNVSGCGVLGNGEFKGKITINAADMNLRDGFGVVSNGTSSCAGDFECKIDDVNAGMEWHGICSSFDCGGNIIMEVNRCSSGYMANVLSAPGMLAAKDVDVTMNDCTFARMAAVGAYAAEDTRIRINGGTYISDGYIAHASAENGAKVSVYLHDVLVKPYSETEVFQIRPYMYGDSVLEITFDDTCTIPDNYEVKLNASGMYDSKGALAVNIENKCYIWGNYPVTAGMLQGKDLVYIENSSLELPEFTAGEISMKKCNLTIPKGVTVKAEDKYVFKETNMLLEGTLQGSCDCEMDKMSPSFYMDAFYMSAFYINGGIIQDSAFRKAATRYYPVTLEYDEAAMEDIYYYSFKTIDSRPELLFAEAEMMATIRCTPKVDSELKGAVCLTESGLALEVREETYGTSQVPPPTGYTFTMPDEPVTVTIMTREGEIIVAKTAEDPAAVVGMQYTQEEPLYNFESLVIYNDDTEGTVNYKLKEGEVLPEGLRLDGSRLIGTPTVVNEEGTKVVFVITGKNGSEAELTLNITVCDRHVHEYGDWICDDEAGDHYAVCECGDIKRADHSYGGYTSTGADTHMHTCKDCKKAVTEAHAWNAGVVTKEPTQTAEGVKTYTCTVCQETKTEAIAKLPTEEPTTEEPTTEEPTTEEPTTEKPTTEEPTTERHIMEIPVIEEPTTGEPTILEPTTEQPTTEEPTNEQSTTEEPTTEQPATREETKAGAPAGTEFKVKGAEFIVVNPAEMDSEDTDTSPAVEYMGSVKASAKKLTIPDTITVNGVDYRVVSVAEETFKDNEKITKVTIGKNVKIIGSGAFENCKALKTVTFKKTSKVKTIAEEAFGKCTALKKITIPKSVETIEDSAFDGCKKLATVTFQSGSKLKNLCRKAFNNCVALKKIKIPKDVMSIGASAFNGCKKLSTFTIQSTKLKTVGKNAFKGIKSNAKIKVPSKKLKAYKKLLKNKGQGNKVKITK